MINENRQQTGDVPPDLWLTPQVFAQLTEMIGSRKAETGGMLGGNRETGEVSAFCFDADALEQSAAAYSPNHIRLTRVLKEEWKPKGIQFLGFVHSHPPYYTHPSPADVEYAGRLMKTMELPYLLLPIIRTAADTGEVTLFPYVAHPGSNGTEISRQGLRIDGTGESLVNQPQSNGNRNLPSLEVLAGIAGAAVDLTAVGIALVQTVRTLRRGEQQGKGENDHDR